MAQQTSVVTPSRFAQGLSYEGFLAQAKVNKNLFDQYYQTAKEQMTQADVDFFKKAVHAPGGAAKVMVIGEDWCPDVYRGMPVIARIAEASGMEIKVFPRDMNLDIMNEFLNQGQFQSIPTLVFYTKDHKYLGHWIERPAQVGIDQAALRTKITAEMQGKPEEEIRAESRKQTNAMFPHFQRLTIDDLKLFLSKFPH